MQHRSASQELHHEIFGSILDRSDLSPYLLLSANNYSTALKQATKMMSNRGFDVVANGELQESEEKRALVYVERTYRYFLKWLFPFVKRQLEALIGLASSNLELYQQSLSAIKQIETHLKNPVFKQIVEQDPRHLFLLASSGKYPTVFHGYQGKKMAVPLEWQQTA